jgi:prepilin peptidase dependent protein B
MYKPTAPRARSTSRGLSIVELMIGIAIGLFVIAGSISLMVENMRANRQNLLATRTNQDLRMAADLVARDLRRAGYWQNAASGIWNSTGAPAALSPHVAVAASGTAMLGTLRYSYSKDSNNALDSNEDFGFSVSNSGVLMYQPSSSAGAQPITDPGVVTVTRFAITATDTGLDMFDICTCFLRGTCTAAQFTQPSGSGGIYNSDTHRPRIFVRKFDLVIQGQSSQNAAIKREIRETVRVRNDEIRGACPAV